MQEKINELKDYAELAQASYFYFDLEDCILQENETIITLNELLNLSYNGKIAGKKEKVGQKYSFISKGELNGEFGELQTKNFIQRYEVQFHQPNTTSGFSATLFYDKQKDEFIVGFRGTEGFWNIDTMQGEFGELQTKNFIQRYEVQFHQPNTTSGFCYFVLDKKKMNLYRFRELSFWIDIKT